jgi:hypothetical protein
LNNNYNFNPLIKYSCFLIISNYLLKKDYVEIVAGANSVLRRLWFLRAGDEGLRKGVKRRREHGERRDFWSLILR